MPYFSPPADQLDPNLFDGDHLKHDVRIWLIAVLEHGLMRYLDLSGVNEWLHVWLAGSGITYQWEGNTDLDVLFGVDMAVFTRYNPEFSGLPESYVADRADAVLKQRLWPQTAHQSFGSQQYEVTFFWNPGTGNDITRIHPYAAYDLKRDLWVVAPPVLPADPQSLYPGDWHAAASRDVDAARAITRRYGSAKGTLASMPADTSQGRNAYAEMIRAEQAAMSLFDDIHGGRREAFGEQGRGYDDWHNYRWQSFKASGALNQVSAIVSEAKARRAAEDTELYGGPVDGPQTILTRDMLNYGRTPYLR